MRKFLLSFAAMASLVAFATPSAQDMANLTLGINSWGETSIGANTVSIAASTSVDGMWEVTGFDKKIDYTVKMSIADDGAVTIAPQMVGGDYDYDTYESIYFMLVPAESINKSPMEFTNDRLTGTYANGVITINDWNIVKVDQSFSTNKGTVYSQNVNTKIMAPNCSTQLGLWDQNLNDDWEFLGWNKLSVSEPNKVVYAEQDGATLKVYNFDEVGTCMTLNINIEGKKAQYNNEEVVFMTTGSTPRNYVMRKIAPVLYGEDDNALADALIVGEISDDYKTITFTDLACVREDHQSMGWVDHASPMHTLILTLDKPLNNSTAITAVETDAQVANVKYVDLSGRMSYRPFKGVNIVVTTYTNGTTATSKVVK